MNYCQCDSPYLMRNEGKSVHCGVCEKVFDYQAWLVRPQNPTHENILLHHEWTLGPQTPDPRRVQCEAVALKIYEQIHHINSEAALCGQVQGCVEAYQAEWCILVADIIQKELEWK